MKSKWIGILRPGLATALGLFLLASGAPAIAQPSPSPSPSPSPVGAAAAQQPLDAAEVRKLAREFRRAQATELKALKHRQKLGMKELKAAQKARLREWQDQENASRRKLFANTTDAKERRAYFKDREARHDAMLKILKDEQAQRERENVARVQAVEQDQAARLKEFSDALRRGERPPESLWPRGQ